MTNLEPDRRPRWSRGFGQQVGPGSRSTWALVLGAVTVTLLSVVHLARFPEWDGAVFLSQSGGFEGLDTTADPLVASRELGTPVLLGLLRALNPTLANTRLLWMALAFVVLVLALRRLGHLCHFPAAIALGFLGTYWLTISFSSSFLSFFLAASTMLAASALYLTLRSRSEDQVRVGFALGIAVAACLWLRHAEGAIFVAVLAAHSFVFWPRVVWKGRRRGAIMAMATFLLLFAIPWALDSASRFGSVRERVAAARGQSFPRGFSNNVGDYLQVLVGRSQHYGDVANPPDWAILLLATLLGVGLLTGVACGIAMVVQSAGSTSDRRRGDPVAGLSLLWLVGIAFTAFFMTYINLVSDKYMVIGSLFLLLAILATTWRLLGPRARTGAPARRLAVSAGIAGLVAVWVVANAVVANSYELARFDAAMGMQQRSATIRALAGAESCSGTTRYRAPVLQFGTGCRVQSATDPQEAADILGQRGEEDPFVFALWPRRSIDELQRLVGSDFRSLPLDRTATGTEWVLLYTGRGAP